MILTLKKMALVVSLASSFNFMPLGVSFVRYASTGSRIGKNTTKSLEMQPELMRENISVTKRFDLSELSRRCGHKPFVVFVLGGPGSGKGTQCEHLSKKLGYMHLSAGELLREARQNGSSEGALIEEYLKEGKIVPVELSLGLLSEAMLKSGCNRFLIDGFPRNNDNYSGWEQMIGDQVQISCVLFLDVPENVMLERLLKRGLKSGRSDDNVESAKKRFKTFNDTTMPVVQKFQDRNLVRIIDGSASVREVQRRSTHAIELAMEAEVLACTCAQIEAALSNEHSMYKSACLPNATAISALSKESRVLPADVEMWGCSAPSKLINVNVRMIGRMGIVSYVRSNGNISLAETRVWSACEGIWKLAHLHQTTLT